MAECRDKNMIDKDEYPRTAELERRCVAMLADLWHAPDPTAAVGCSTTGSSEACMLAGMALKRRWASSRNAEPRYPAGDRPNLVMGVNVQVCWDKFCSYWEVEPRLVPMEGDRFHLDAGRPSPSCATRTPSASWPSSARPSTAATSRSPRSARRSTRSRSAPAWTSRSTSTAPPARWSRRSSTPTWCGTSGCRGSRRSTRRATSTGWSTRASAGCCGATPTRCPTTWCSGSTTSAATCPRSRSTSPGPAPRSSRSTTPSCGSAARATGAVQQASRDVAT